MHKHNKRFRTLGQFKVTILKAITAKDKPCAQTISVIALPPLTIQSQIS